MAPQLDWSPTKPVRGCNAPEIPQTEWEKYRELLKNLYITNNKTLKQVQEYMRTHHNFTPSTHQYTQQFKHWQYFKNCSRYRQQHPNRNGPTLQRPSVQSSSVPQELPDEYRNDNLEEAHDARSAGDTENQVQMTTHVSYLEGRDSKAYIVNAEFPPSQCLAAGPTLAAIEEPCNELLRQSTEKSLNDAIPPDELRQRLVQASHGGVRDTWTSGLFPCPEEDQSTPALSRALSMDDSNSIETDSLSSFESGGDPVRVLMDVDNEAMTQLPIVCDEDSIYGVGVPLAGQPVSVYTAPAHIDVQMPVLSEETWTYRPSQLLKAEAAQSKLFTDDLDQIRHVADFFYAARSLEDAFDLYRTIFSQATGHLSLAGNKMWCTVFSVPPKKLCLSLATPLVLQGAIGLMKSATTAANCAEIARLIPDIDPSELQGSPTTSAKICLLHSHLGICYHALGRLGSAEHHCHIGLQKYRQLPEQLQYIGCKATLLSNLGLVLRDSGQPRGLGEPLSDIFPVHLFRGSLYQYVNTYSITLQTDAFNHVLLDVNEALWEEAPTPGDLANFEMTVLFCCFWAQWHAERQPTSWRRERLGHFAEQTGITPTETLSTLASLILDPKFSTFHGIGHSQSEKGAQTMRSKLDGPNELAPGNKETFGQRAILFCRNLATLSAIELFDTFLHAYASPLRGKGCRFSSQTYDHSVQAFVRGFADSHFLLTLSESASVELRSCTGPGRPWISPSFDPPMLPTPRLSRMSFSSFEAFKNAGRREKQFARNSGSDAKQVRTSDKRWSTGSSILKKRLSQLSSVLSLNTSIFSVKEDDSEDVMMQDAF